MLTGILKYRSSHLRRRGEPRQTSNDLLAHLLQSRSLRPHVFARQCEVGPFVVDHVCMQRALIVQLEPRAGAEDPRHQARCWFLQELGYSVLNVSRFDLTSRPMHVIEQVRAALR